jgi:hypothetical protein
MLFLDYYFPWLNPLLFIQYTSCKKGATSSLSLRRDHNQFSTPEMRRFAPFLAPYDRPKRPSFYFLYEQLEEITVRYRKERELNPWFVTGFVDGEGCLTVPISQKQGGGRWYVVATFQFGIQVWSISTKFWFLIKIVANWRF